MSDSGPRVCLDLFSGLGGFSDAFDDADGWDVITVDLDPDGEFEPDIRADVMDLRPDDFPEVDVVLASPPCTYFSTARNLTKGGDDAWLDDRPQSPEAREHLTLVYHAYGLVEGLAPDYWFFENPRGMLRKRFDIPPTGTVWYCRYGAPTAKPTDLWGRHPRTFEYLTCHAGNDSCHHEKTDSYSIEGEVRGGSISRQGLLKNDDAAERAVVPYGLSRAILDAVEDAYRNPPPEQSTLSGVFET